MIILKCGEDPLEAMHVNKEIENMLKKIEEPIHYSEIIESITNATGERPEVIFYCINNNPQILINGMGYCSFGYDKNCTEQEILEKKSNNGKDKFLNQNRTSRIDKDKNNKEKALKWKKHNTMGKSKTLLNYGMNHNGNMYIKYKIIRDMFQKKYTLKLPPFCKNKLESKLCFIDIRNNEYSLRFNNRYRYVRGIDWVINSMGLEEGEEIVLEILNSKRIRVFEAEDYDQYCEENCFGYKDNQIFEEENNKNYVSDIIDELFEIREA